MIEQKAKMCAAIGTVLIFGLLPLRIQGAELCPSTLSQGGLNKSGSIYTLHDSVGGIGSATVTGASHQAAGGYIPQLICGCNCLPCDQFLAQACTEVTTVMPTSYGEMLTLLGQILGASDLASVDVCADGASGGGSPEGCSAYITQTFQDAISTP